MKLPEEGQKTRNKLITNLYLESMKSKLRFILVGDNAIVDENTQKLTMIGLFSDIKIPDNTDKTTLSFVVAGQLTADGTKVGDIGELIVNILAPDGSLHHSINISGAFGPDGKVQFVAYFQFIEFSKVGEYKIQVLLNGDAPEIDERVCFFNVNKNV